MLKTLKLTNDNFDFYLEGGAAVYVAFESLPVKFYVAAILQYVADDGENVVIDLSKGVVKNGSYFISELRRNRAIFDMSEDSQLVPFSDELSFSLPSNNDNLTLILLYRE